MELPPLTFCCNCCCKLCTCSSDFFSAICSLTISVLQLVLALSTSVAALDNFCCDSSRTFYKSKQGRLRFILRRPNMWLQDSTRIQLTLFMYYYTRRILCICYTHVCSYRAIIYDGHSSVYRKICIFVLYINIGIIVALHVNLTTY